MSSPDDQVPSVRTPAELPEGVSQATIGVRGGLLRSGFDETAEAIYPTSGYVYPSAADAEKAFAGEIDRYVYSRYGNPTIAMFEERLRLIEGAPACFATATGMAAVFTSLGALLAAGDRLVAARSLFGSCFVVCNEILPRWGIETVFVDGDDLSQWEEALSKPTQAVFFETPSNPMQSLVDIAAVTEMAHSCRRKSGAGQRVRHSDSAAGLPAWRRRRGVLRHEAHRRPGPGARRCDPRRQEYIDEPVQKLMRHTGPALSPFNAWVLLKGLETLAVRVQHSNDAALRVAQFLQDHSAVSWVRYPFLESHPQYDLAKRQMTGGGTVVTFELKGGTQGERVRGARQAADHRHLEQPRRREVADHASGHHHTPGDGTRWSCFDRPRRRSGPDLGGAGGNRGPDRGSGPGAQLGVEANRVEKSASRQATSHAGRELDTGGGPRRNRRQRRARREFGELRHQDRRAGLGFRRRPIRRGIRHLVLSAVRRRGGRGQTNQSRRSGCT